MLIGWEQRRARPNRVFDGIESGTVAIAAIALCSLGQLPGVAGHRIAVDFEPLSFAYGV
jgi:hypothetical protein